MDRSLINSYPGQSYSPSWSGQGKTLNMLVGCEGHSMHAVWWTANRSIAYNADSIIKNGTKSIAILRTVLITVSPFFYITYAPNKAKEIKKNPNKIVAIILVRFQNKKMNEIKQTAY